MFDVGANVGHYSEMLSNTFNDECNEGKCTIFAFEPSAATFQRLVNNTRHLPSLRKFNCGMSDTSETLTIFTNMEGSGLASLYQRDLASIDVKLSLKEEVKLKSIDSFCQEEAINSI